MSTTTNDDLERLLAAADPLGEDTGATVPLDPVAVELGECLMATPRDGGVRPAGRRRPALARATASLATVAVLSLAMLLLVAGRDGGGGSTAWAAPLVQLAESSPLLLLDGAGWTVTRVDEYDAAVGEMTFQNGERTVELYWRGGGLDQWQRDRAFGAAQVLERSVLGARAQVAQYADEQGRGISDFTAIWPDGEHAVEVRANTPTLDEFEAVLALLTRVDVDRWLSSLPPSAVKVTERDGEIDAMLADIPLPPGFDPAELKAVTLVEDRYQLGAEVTAAVTCAWIERWDDGRKRGDRAMTREAATAMATAHGWRILEDMEADGGWTDAVLMFADAMGPDGSVPAGQRFPKGSVMENARDGLGCSRWWG